MGRRHALPAICCTGDHDLSFRADVNVPVAGRRWLGWQHNPRSREDLIAGHEDVADSGRYQTSLDEVRQAIDHRLMPVSRQVDDGKSAKLENDARGIEDVLAQEPIVR
jgi:hypothetical protein